MENYEIKENDRVIKNGLLLSGLILQIIGSVMIMFVGVILGTLWIVGSLTGWGIGLMCVWIIIPLVTLILSSIILSMNEIKRELVITSSVFAFISVFISLVSGIICLIGGILTLVGMTKKNRVVDNTNQIISTEYKA